jgi:hypothetical protein
MGFFSWLGGLFNQAVDWLVAKVNWLKEKIVAFLNNLFDKLQRLWNTVSNALITAFGYLRTLYVIFYQGSISGETIMEIWDSNRVYDQASQLFKLRQAPQGSPLPTYRSEAQVLILEDWY